MRYNMGHRVRALALGEESRLAEWLGETQGGLLSLRGVAMLALLGLALLMPIPLG